MNNPVVLSFGGGVNSTALLIYMWWLGEKPDLILFSDTGGEKPETYKHVHIMRSWAQDRGMRFEIVSNAGRGDGETLEEYLLDRNSLPSLAYGYRGCSQSWKRNPMDRFVKEWEPAKAAWLNGHKVVRCIGIDASESRRAVLTEDKRFIYRYPLVRDKIDREQCIKIIKDEGIEVPPKSSCFFCPAMKRHEVLKLANDHPDLLARALDIEANATYHTLKGLGVRWNWNDFIKNGVVDNSSVDQPSMPCGCSDESEDDD